MAITIYTYANSNNGRVIEIPDYIEDLSADNNSQLSVDERMALLEQFTDKFMEFVGPDFKPLSEDAISREGIYADHP